MSKKPLGTSSGEALDWFRDPTDTWLCVTERATRKRAELRWYEVSSGRLVCEHSVEGTRAGCFWSNGETCWFGTLEEAKGTITLYRAAIPDGAVEKVWTRTFASAVDYCFFSAREPPVEHATHALIQMSEGQGSDSRVGVISLETGSLLWLQNTSALALPRGVYIAEGLHPDGASFLLRSHAVPLFAWIDLHGSLRVQHREETFQELSSVWWAGPQTLLQGTRQFKNKWQPGISLLNLEKRTLKASLPLPLFSVEEPTEYTGESFRDGTHWLFYGRSQDSTQQALRCFSLSNASLDVLPFDEAGVRAAMPFTSNTYLTIAEQSGAWNARLYSLSTHRLLETYAFASQHETSVSLRVDARKRYLFEERKSYRNGSMKCAIAWRALQDTPFAAAL